MLLNTNQLTPQVNMELIILHLVGLLDMWIMHMT